MIEKRTIKREVITDKHTTILDIVGSLYRNSESLLEEDINTGISKFKGSFFIVHMYVDLLDTPNKKKDIAFIRLTMPQPDYGQVLYYYDKKKGKTSRLWILPNKEMCQSINNNRTSVKPENYELLKSIIDFYDGTLSKKALDFNINYKGDFNV